MLTTRNAALAVAACIVASCAPSRPPAACPPLVAPDRSPPSVSPPPAVAVPASDLPPAPETVVGPAFVPLKRRIDLIVEQASHVRPTVVTEGEDATSGYSTVTWRAKGGSILKLRSVWNGGCCYAPEVHDLIVDGDELLLETFSVAPHADSAALMRGVEARSAIVLEQLYFRDDKLVLWSDQQGRTHVDGAIDPQRWRERERQSHERASNLRTLRF